MAFFNANAKIIGGNIDDTIIGATTPVAGTFTTLTANTTLTAGGSGSGNVNKFYVDGTGANDATKIVQVNDGSHDCFWIDGSGRTRIQELEISGDLIIPGSLTVN